MTARAPCTSVGARSEDVVAGPDLARMDQRLSVEAQLTPLAGLGEEAVGVPDVVEHSVEHATPAARAASRTSCSEA